jgi:hypothetical protein
MRSLATSPKLKPPRSVLMAVSNHVSKNYLALVAVASLGFAAYTYSLIPELVLIANDNKETVFVNDLRGHVETTITDKNRPPELWTDTINAELTDWAIKVSAKVHANIREDRTLAQYWLVPKDQRDFGAQAATDIAEINPGAIEQIPEPHHVVHSNSYETTWLRTPKVIYQSQIYLDLKEKTIQGVRDTGHYRQVAMRWQFLSNKAVKARRQSYGITYAMDNPLGIEILEYTIADLPK